MMNKICYYSFSYEQVANIRLILLFIKLPEMIQKSTENKGRKNVD